MLELGPMSKGHQSTAMIRSGRHEPLGGRKVGGWRRLMTVFAAFALGSLAWFLPHSKTSRLPVGDLPSLDYFVRVSSKPSFSEVQNARDLLKADCLRSLSALQLEWRESWSKGTHTSTGTGPVRSAITDPVRCRHFVAAISQKIEECGSLDDQCLLYRELFTTLKVARLYDQWLDTYLRLLYERPTLPLLSHCANTAVKFALKTHRTAEVSRAFTLVTSIPLDFAGKPVMEALAQKLGAEGQAGNSQANLPAELFTAVP